MKNRTRHIVSRAVIEPVESRMLMTTVALFMNSSYVDTVTTDGTPAAATNLSQELTGLGYTVKSFTSFDLASINSALSGSDALIIPSLDKGDLAGVMTTNVKNAIAAFVQAGGGFATTGDPSGRNTTLISDTFGFPTFHASRFTTNDWNITNVTGTAFAGGPAFVRDTGGVYAIDSFNGGVGTTIPGSKNIYSSDAFVNFDPESSVALFPAPVSKRLSVAFLGRDWYRGGPNGTQDGNWKEALNRTVKQIARVSPAPSNFKAYALNTKTVNLSWTDTTSNETSFSIERATAAAGPFAVVGSVGPNIAAYTNTIAEAPATRVFYYRVRAIGPSGNSPYSTTVSATVPGSTFAAISGTTLTVNGTNDNDRIAVSIAGGTVTVRRGLVGSTATPTTMTFAGFAATNKIVINGLDGNDSITVGASTIGTTILGASISGGLGNDTLLGGNGPDTILGNAGDDVIAGHGGKDSVDGGDGNDVFFMVDSAIDTVVGGNGVDTLYGDASDVRSLVEDIVT